MFTFEKAVDLQAKFVAFYEAGKIACALCHGVSLLRYAKLSSGERLAKGKTVTGFANVEEDFADNAVWSMNLLPRDKHVTPWRIEDELKKIGANYIQAGLWRGLCRSGWQSDHGSAELLGFRNSRRGGQGARRVNVGRLGGGGRLPIGRRFSTCPTRDCVLLE